MDAHGRGVDWTVLPERYVLGEAYLLGRVCERFGWKPADLAAMDPREVAVWVAFDHVRRQEEARERRV